MLQFIEFYDASGQRLATWHKYPCVPRKDDIVLLATGRPGSGELFEYFVERVYLTEMGNIHVKVSTL